MLSKVYHATQGTPADVCALHERLRPISKELLAPDAELDAAGVQHDRHPDPFHHARDDDAQPEEEADQGAAPEVEADGPEASNGHRSKKEW